MHVRMQDSANVEINNPMYLKEDYDYEASEALNGSVLQDIDDVSFFQYYNFIFSDSKFQFLLRLNRFFFTFFLISHKLKMIFFRSIFYVTNSKDRT